MNSMEGKLAGFGRGLVVAMALALPVTASAAEGVDDERRGVIKELIEVTQVERQIRGLGETAQGQAKQEAPFILERALIENKNLSENQKQAVAEKLKKGAVQKLIDQSGKMFVSDGFRADAVKAHYDVYGKTFTAQELKDLLAFYKSPTGQKYLANQGKIEQEIIGTVMQKYVPQSRKSTRDAADREIAAAAK